MMKRLLFCVLACAAFFVRAAAPGVADAPTDPYAAFTASASGQHGLFGVWHKAGHVYLDITTSQLDTDNLETIVPGNGIGSNFIVWGNTDHLPAMLVRFERAGDGIAIVWPNTSFVAPGSDSGTLAVRSNFPQSVIGIGKIAAEGGGHIVFDASPLFSDALDMVGRRRGQVGDHVVPLAGDLGLIQCDLGALRHDRPPTWVWNIFSEP